MRGSPILALALAVASAAAWAQSAKQVSGATILVSCDRACLWTLDGKPMGNLDSEVAKSVVVSLGQHHIHAEAREGLYVDEKKVDLDDPSETIVNLRLKETGDPLQVVAQPTATNPSEVTGEAESCVDVPRLSVKVPALPEVAPCARHLYTVADAKLDYVSPLEGLALTTIVGWKRTSESYSLDYVDIRVGTGPLAILHKWVAVHYTGYLVDGTRFDSSLDRGEPIVFSYGDGHMIVGWETGFAGMRVGGKRRLFIPSQLGYGTSRKGPIPPNAELVFDVEFIGESDQPPKGRAPNGPGAE